MAALLGELGMERVPRSVRMARTLLNTAPNRVWFRTDRGWASRPWKKGEKDAYIKEVLRPHEARY